MAIRSVGIDTRWLESTVAAAGTTTYIKGLSKALLKLDQQTHFQFWGSPPGVSAPNANYSAFRGQYRRAWQLVWKTVGWPMIDAVAPDVDLWHFTNYIAPPTKRPFVASMLDLGFVHHREYTEPKNSAYLEKFVPETIARAEHLIAISESTKEALIDAYSVPKHRISVTPLACDERYFDRVPKEDIARIRDKYGIDGDYFLAVGTLEPRKNLKNLLLAFAGIRKQTTEQLVVVGGQGWLFEETQALLRKLGLGQRVIFTGYAPTTELPALYQGAKLFVFPSHYEGFGLPLLEAMASGTPVLTSNTSSLPEVGGTAALYFDPEDTDALKSGLKHALEDEPLRERLAEAGLVQAKKFSWEKTAVATKKVYDDVLG